VLRAASAASTSASSCPSKSVTARSCETTDASNDGARLAAVVVVCGMPTVRACALKGALSAEGCIHASRLYGRVTAIGTSLPECTATPALRSPGREVQDAAGPAMVAVEPSCRGTRRRGTKLRGDIGRRTAERLPRDIGRCDERDCGGLQPVPELANSLGMRDDGRDWGGLQLVLASACLLGTTMVKVAVEPAL